MTSAMWLSAAQIGIWVPLTTLFAAAAGALVAMVAPRQ